MQVLRTIKLSSLFFLGMLFFSSCYYDNKEELYPYGSSVCDTASISYTKHVAPIMAQYCNTCHNQNNASGTWKTETHTNLVATVNGGRFKGSINHQSGFSNMPSGGAKLNSCNLSQINAWINAKMPNN